MVDVLSVLPGNRLEMKREEDEDAAVPGTGGKGVAANGHPNRSGTNGNNGINGRGARGTLLNNMTGQGLRPTAVAAVKGCSGDDGDDSGGVVAPEAEFDPWALLSELLDFVRWLRGLDSARWATHGLESKTSTRRAFVTFGIYKSSTACTTTSDRSDVAAVELLTEPVYILGVAPLVRCEALLRQGLWFFLCVLLIYR